MTTLPYVLRPPTSTPVPIVLSCPHVGTEIPPDIAATMTPLARRTPDTDWFVHDLYGFAPAMGITLVHARFSRYVVDLNRDPAGAKLYADGRAETGLVPVQSFAREPLYDGPTPDAAELRRRVDRYYKPYHAAIEAALSELRQRHAHVLFFDAHSIKRRVPSIRPEPFADVILGDQAGRTAHRQLARTALDALQGLDVAHNEPFMGGYLTRSFGRPAEGRHALQLEMSQDLYMDEDAGRRDASKEARVQAILKSLLTQLAHRVTELA